MADEVLKRDANTITVLGGITDDSNQYITMLRVDPSTKRLLVSATGSGAGTVTSVSVVTANGVSGSVATATTTPAITLTLGAITPTTVNGLTITANGTNTLSITAGKTLSVVKTMSFTSADDTGVYTLPTGTKTLLATNGAGTSLTGIPYTLTGTANQVVLSAGTGNITFSLPQDIATGSTVQFAAIELSHATQNTLTASGGVLSIEGVVIPTISSTNTLTNKRVTPRILSAVAYTTDTGSSINGDTQDMFIVTAQTGALKFNNPSGTPTDGQKFIISVASSTTSARALTWDTAYGSTTVTLPTTTAATTATLTIGFIWSASKSLWQCVAVA